jgi:hypothetical protein
MNNNSLFYEINEINNINNTKITYYVIIILILLSGIGLTLVLNLYSNTICFCNKSSETMRNSFTKI